MADTSSQTNTIASLDIVPAQEGEGALTINDAENISHLMALETLSTSSEDISEEDLDSQVPLNTNPGFRPNKKEEVLSTHIRRSSINWVLDKNNVPDQNRIRSLIEANEAHKEELIRASITRAKQQMTHLENSTPNRILKDITLLKFRPNKEVRSLKNNLKKSVHINEPYVVSLQQENLAVPDTVRTTWSQARNSEIESSRKTNRAAFYREEPALVNEYWCYQLEKVPQYLMKLTEFKSEMYAMRVSHANELMCLAAKHLEQEAKRCSNSAAALKATSITLIQQAAPATAQQIIAKANIGLNITVANM